MDGAKEGFTGIRSATGDDGCSGLALDAQGLGSVVACHVGLH